MFRKARFLNKSLIFGVPSEIVILFGLARRTARKSRKYRSFFAGEATARRELDMADSCPALGRHEILRQHGRRRQQLERPLGTVETTTREVVAELATHKKMRRIWRQGDMPRSGPRTVESTVQPTGAK